jgi:hypothetical protein
MLRKHLIERRIYARNLPLSKEMAKNLQSFGPRAWHTVDAWSERRRKQTLERVRRARQSRSANDVGAAARCTCQGVAFRTGGRRSRHLIARAELPLELSTHVGDARIEYCTPRIDAVTINSLLNERIDKCFAKSCKIL